MKKQTTISKRKLKPKKIEFVFIGNNYESKKRAEGKCKNLESAGYIKVSENSKKITYEL
jgi:hypothetical protein